jgi:hypothetical protein
VSVVVVVGSVVVTVEEDTELVLVEGVEVPASDEVAVVVGSGVPVQPQTMSTTQISNRRMDRQVMSRFPQP